MDEATFRTMLEQHFASGSHAMYHDDAVLEFPQSGERFVGVENMREWRSNYPANTAVEYREIRGRDDLWVAEISITYDGGPPHLRGERPRVPWRQDRPRDDLRWRGLGGAGVAGAVEVRVAGQGVMRTATSYFVTEARRPGVSPAGIACRTSSPRL